MTTSIQKWGNSQGIRIPKIVLETLDWNNDDQLVIRTENDKIVIEKAEKRKSIDELFADYQDDYKPEEIDWGKPVGREVW